MLCVACLWSKEPDGDDRNIEGEGQCVVEGNRDTLQHWPGM